MKIEGSPKEIAALVVALQERREPVNIPFSIDAKGITQDVLGAIHGKVED